MYIEMRVKFRMNSGELLTLAMSETTRSQYHIVGYLYDICDFVFFTINKFREDNQYLIDIGAISKISYELVSENEIKVAGDILLYKYLSKNEFADFLNRQNSNFAYFKRNINLKFSIIKPKHIEEFKVVNEANKVDSYATIVVNGMKEVIKVKDYRWLKYWEYILKMKNEQKLQERITHYAEFFNSNETYMLLYRFKNADLNNNRYRNKKDIYWISSIFYIEV